MIPGNLFFKVPSPASKSTDEDLYKSPLSAQRAFFHPTDGAVAPERNFL